MRFAWLRTNYGSEAEQPSSGADRAILVAYNVVWWVPVVSTVLGITSYTTGLVIFTAGTIARAMINLYRNNIMPLEQAQDFPLRLP